jgi:PAS domain S-box-containing protein
MILLQLRLVLTNPELWRVVFQAVSMNRLDIFNILIVDDNKNNLFTLHTLIDEHLGDHIGIIEADSGINALEVLLQDRIDLILLDVQMPEMDGFETAQLIRSRKKTQHIPIVFLTAAYKSEDFRQKGFSVGAADYLTKPIDAIQLINRIKSYLRFIEQERQHSSVLEDRVQARTSELLAANNKLQQEIIERKLVEQQLQEARNQLEQRILERTEELSTTNQKLKTEINERRQAEIALKKLSRQTHLILESAGEGICGVDIQGKIMFINPAAVSMLGYQPEELVGRVQHDIMHHKRQDGSDYPHGECPVCEALKDGIIKRIDNEVFWRKSGTSFPVEYVVAPIWEDNEVIGAVVTFRDITKQKETEQFLTIAKETAEAANLAKSRFLANMSHELRTPLNAIIGYSEMLMEQAEDLGAPDLVHDLGNIQVAGKHLLSLISDILDFSKIEAGKMQLSLHEFKLAVILDTLLVSVRPQLEKARDKFTVVFDETLGLMYSDSIRVQQVLLNLLSNAAKFTQNGEVTFSAQRFTEQHIDYIKFVITDTGIGISPEQQRKLFQPFTQADASATRRYGGSGLGLSISKQLVNMMGGTIRLDSETGRGTSFTVILPASINPPHTYFRHPPSGTETDHA